MTQLGLRWVVDGNGSAFVGKDLAGQLIYGRARPAWGPIGGVLIFAAAVAGAWTLATALSRRRMVGVVRAAFGLIMLSAMVGLALVDTFRFEQWGLGAQLLAVAGVLLLLSGLAVAFAVEWEEGWRPGLLGRAAAVALGSAAAGVAGFLIVEASAGVESGEPNPEAAVERLVASLDRSDLFGAMTIVSAEEAVGVEVALRELETALRSAPAVGNEEASIELGVSIGRLSSRGLATGVVEVTADVRVTGSVSGIEDGVLRPIAESNGWTAEEFRIITVFEDGGWWVSPMLTAAANLVEDLGLPEGDYRRITDAAGSRNVAVSEQAAMDAIAEGLSESKPLVLAQGVDGGARRLIAVYEDAVQVALDRVDREFGLRVDDVSLSLPESGLGALEAVTGRADHFGGRSRQLDVGGSCSDPGGARLCVLDGLPFTEPIALDELPLVFGDSDGGPTLQVLATAVRWLAYLAPMVDPSLAATVLDSPEMLPAASVAVDSAVEVSLSQGVLFGNISIATVPGEPLSLSLTGDQGIYATVYEEGSTSQQFVTSLSVLGDSATPLPSIVVPTSSSLMVRVIAPTKCNSARLVACSPAPGAGTLAVHSVRSAEIVPDDSITVTLEPGEVQLVRFTSRGDGRYRLLSNSPGLGLYTYSDETDELVTELPTGVGEVFEVDAGENVVLAMVNLSSARGVFELAVEEAPLPQGFWTGSGLSSQVTVGIEYGIHYVELSVRPGTSVRVLAVPNSGQDIVLDGDCPGCTRADVGFSGDSESLNFYSGSRTSVVLSVDGWSSYNDYGTVTLYAYFE